ncbi:MAG: hypothetical protein VKK97_11495 [Synechococcaceae cyanobacterium]|nr:hypothetical protein [Synechococcaceae cyanobacterium]
MALPTTAAELFDLLMADETISDGLGTYTFKDGTTAPAMVPLFAGESLPPGTTIDGIEISISRLPLYGPQALYDGVMLNPTFRIYVAAWGDASTLQAMVERVMALLPGATGRSIEGDKPGAGLGVIDQVVVAWTNPTAVVSADG